jgi:uncharacterized protein (TIGR00266 family)
MKFIEQYGQWFCHSCGQYHKPQQPQAEQYQQPQQPQQQPQQQYQPQQIQAPVGGDLEYETVHSPSFTALLFYLRQGQSVVAEKGAMMYMHRTIEIKTHGRKGGILKGVVTSALGAESFFVNTFTATQGPGEIALVGPTMGDIRVIDVSKQGMIIQSGAYLASAPQVNLDTKWQGLKGFLSERDFVMLHASGPGNVWVSSFGGIIEMNLKQGEVLSVDTGHLVAFPNTMQFSVRRVGGWKSTILSGEGLVTDLVGPGKILMQTRHLPAFVEALLPFLPQQR